jgi:hypothetical protein
MSTRIAFLDFSSIKIYIVLFMHISRSTTISVAAVLISFCPQLV